MDYGTVNPKFLKDTFNGCRIVLDFEEEEKKIKNQTTAFNKRVGYLPV